MFPYDYRSSKFATYHEMRREHTYAERYYRQRIFRETFGGSTTRAVFAIVITILTLGFALVLHLTRRIWWWYSENHRRGVLNPVKPPRVAFAVPWRLIQITGNWLGVLVAVGVFLPLLQRSDWRGINAAIIDTNLRTPVQIAFAILLFTLARVTLGWLANRVKPLRWFLVQLPTLIFIAILVNIIFYYLDQIGVYRPLFLSGRGYLDDSVFHSVLDNIFLVITLLGVLAIRPKQSPTSNTSEVEDGSDSNIPTITGHPQIYRIYLDQEADRSADFNALFLEYIIAIFGECTFRMTGNCESIFWEIVDMRGHLDPVTAMHAIHVKLPHVRVVHIPAFSALQRLEYIRDLVPNLDHVPNRVKMREAVAKLDALLQQMQAGEEVNLQTITDIHPYLTTTHLYSIGHFLRYVAPLRSAYDLTDDEYPLADVTQVINQVPANEFMTATLIVNGVSQYAQHRGYRYITIPYGIGSTFLSLFGRGTRIQNPRFSPHEFGMMEEKLHQQLYHCLYFISHTAVATPLSRNAFGLLGTALAQVSLRSANRLVVFDNEQLGMKAEVKEDARSAFEYAHTAPFQYYNLWTTDPDTWTTWRHTEMILTSGEMANLWRLPDEHFTADSIEWLDQTPPVSDAILQNSIEENGVVLGIGRRDGEDVPVFLPDDTRHRHISVLGQTGMGKSTFLHNLIHQDIANNDGRSVVVVDPHGDLIDDVLLWSIPPERQDDVVVLQLNNRSYPIPFNLFAMSSDHRTLEQIADVIDMLEPGTAGFQTKRYLYLGLRAIAHLDEPTILDFLALLENQEYAQTIIERCREAGDHVAADTWDGYWAKSTGASLRNSLKTPLLNRISIFYMNDYLMHSLCHPNGLNLDELLSGGKILLFSLDNSGVSVSAAQQNLVGAIFVSLLKSVVMTRTLQQRRPVFCYVDEQQRFATPAFAEIFSEARKRGLYMTVGNQYTHQLGDETVAAIRGNVTTHVIFKVGLDDIARFETLIGDPFDRDDLLNLDRFTMAIRTQINGYSQPPFLAHTLPPPTTIWGLPENAEKDQFRDEADQRAQEIVQQSINRQGWMARREVVDYINRRYFVGNADRPLRGGTVTFDE